MSDRRSRVLALSLVDQVLSSVSNMAIVVAVARVSSPTEFGQIALGYAVLLGVLAVARAGLGTPVALRAGDPPNVVRETQHAIAFSLVVGCLLGIGFTVAAVVGDFSFAFILLGLAAPFMLAQDVTRYGALAADRVQVALWSDGIWCALSLAALFFTVGRPDEISAEAIIGVWLAGAVFAAFLAVLTLDSRPRFRGIMPWLRIDAQTRANFAAEGAVTASISIILTAAVALLIGADGVAALRGAATVIGPLNVLMSASTLALVPEIRRGSRAAGGAVSGARTLLSLRPVGIGLSTIAVLIGVICYGAPADWGRAVLGETWTIARPIIPIVAFEYVAHAWLLTASTTLRVLAASALLFRLHLLLSVIAVSGGCLVAWISREAIAVAASSAISVWVVAIVAMAIVHRERVAV